MTETVTLRTCSPVSSEPTVAPTGLPTTSQPSSVPTPAPTYSPTPTGENTVDNLCISLEHTWVHPDVSPGRREWLFHLVEPPFDLSGEFALLPGMGTFHNRLVYHRVVNTSTGPLTVYLRFQPSTDAPRWVMSGALRDDHLLYAVSLDSTLHPSDVSGWVVRSGPGRFRHYASLQLDVVTSTPTAAPTDSPATPRPSPTRSPTGHACTDGNHGCDATPFGVCSTLVDGTGHRCSCATTHHCSDGDCSTVGHTCERNTNTPTAQPGLDHCNVISCARLCNDECGWSRSQAKCVSGLTTSPDERALGDDCPADEPVETVPDPAPGQTNQGNGLPVEPSDDDGTSQADTSAGANGTTQQDATSTTLIVVAIIVVLVVAAGILWVGNNVHSFVQNEQIHQGDSGTVSNPMYTGNGILKQDSVAAGHLQVRRQASHYYPELCHKLKLWAQPSDNIQRATRQPVDTCFNSGSPAPPPAYPQRLG